MQIIFTPKAKKDLDFWVKSGNKNILRKINTLLKTYNFILLRGLENPKL